MLELLNWLEASALAAALRGAGVWTYALLNLGHIAGVSVLFGSVLILDLRLLGLWRDVPLRIIARCTMPAAVAGVAMAIVSGALMISFNASEYDGNPFLYIKLPVIALALLNAFIVTRLPAWRTAMASVGEHSARASGAVLKVAGGLSLALWTTVLAMGRMIGYW